MLLDEDLLASVAADHDVEESASVVYPGCSSHTPYTQDRARKFPFSSKADPSVPFLRYFR